MATAAEEARIAAAAKDWAAQMVGASPQEWAALNPEERAVRMRDHIRKQAAGRLSHGQPAQSATAPSGDVGQRLFEMGPEQWKRLSREDRMQRLNALGGGDIWSRKRR